MSASTNPSISDDSNDSDEALFGSLAVQLSDDLTTNLDAALRKGIHTLPMLGEDYAPSLLKQLQQPYYRNIDLFELYSQRNIFSLQNFPPLQRLKIAQLVLNTGWDHEAYLETAAAMEEEEPEQDELNSNIDKTSTNTSATLPPNTPAPIRKSHIPSPNKLITIEQELLGRRQHLESLRQKRRQLEQRVWELDAAHQLVDLAGNALPASTATQAAAAVAQTIQAVDTVADLQQQGRALSQHMEHVKRQRNDDDNDDIVVPPTQLQQLKKKTVLAERYEQDRRVLTGGGASSSNTSTTTAATLDKVRALVRN